MSIGYYGDFYLKTQWKSSNFIEGLEMEMFKERLLGFSVDFKIIARLRDSPPKYLLSHLV